ncbi:glutamyl-tRNA amidotransferase subunit A [Calocera cornea HHB12733]|uniref:Glutamyl-tRNA amidotransferase subunit A n=1 Tax=Calocera cornea HHB12733 TaxID=1353952 RepID=A0A165E2Q2_9BASI|nr:glutamyl-tRNA amidotransferase subunit A [Calocera cornea HHB12733]
MKVSILAAILSALVAVVEGVPYKGISPKNGKPLPDLLYASIDDLQEGMAAGTFSSVDLVKAYLGRIAEVNPLLHALIETNPDAVDLAAGLDDERANGTIRGPLHGIPIIVKDNVGTFDKMNTTAGSFAFLGAKLPRDSNVAKGLKAAGAIILGKANLSQWANHRGSNSTNGWTARGGQTWGAYFPMQDPSGSSSGSGVSSSIGLAAAAIGTETSGSIISPSQRNNLAGIKPSVGLTSRDLVIPISEDQDTVGPMARSIKDAAYVLSAIAGKTTFDNYTMNIPFDTIPDYAAGCLTTGLFKVKIGIPRNHIFNSSTTANTPEVAAFNKSIAVFKSLGAIITESADFPQYAEYRASSNSSLVNSIDFLKDLQDYAGALTSNPNNVTDVPSLITFTENFPAEDYPDRNVNSWITDVARGANGTVTRDSPSFQAALAADLYLGAQATILGALEKYDLDALIMPSSMSPGVAAIAGYPIVTIPLGFYPANTTAVINSRGTLYTAGPHFPFGISFLGRRFSEAQLVTFAYAFEQATKVRETVTPMVVPNINLIDVM